ncbi:CDP-alcohol phosphatidyltransferase family protein [Pedobacter arcticus]|uniref:CDP-alcohol phosphatidyltransferase family protein n=1 Tax=Pedobacter arcticus TaxID=752140 RepID=UPI0002ED1659|nr:CDP-alcohol phosphatidyltransferase family protein [Pedobacter arcticus]
MSKLPKQYQFIDLSDYGRIPGRWLAISLKNTSFTPVGVTTLFIITGLLAIVAIMFGYLALAAFLLILKSTIDAADGELSRLKNTPSYTGRYYDSIADIILNFLFLLTFMYLTNASFLYTFLAFVGIQLQGTIYNYYYVILRHSVEGDSTSRIFEIEAPIALKGEKQTTVNLFYKIYYFLYGTFDKVVYLLDKDAVHSKPFPKWFMTMLSMYGLGFQLLIMAAMLVFGLQVYIIPFFIFYSVFIFVFIGIRKYYLGNK